MTTATDNIRVSGERGSLHQCQQNHVI